MRSSSAGSATEPEPPIAQRLLQPASAQTIRAARWIALGLVIIAAAAWLLWFQDFGLVLLRVTRPMVWSFAAAFAIAVWWVAKGSHWRIVGLLASCLVALTAVAVTFLALLFGGSLAPDLALNSPSGGQVLIVESGSHAIDPIWHLRLEETSGLAARYWNIGCINGDYLDYSGARWISDNLIELTIDDTKVPLAVAAGGPVEPVDERLRSC